MRLLCGWAKVRFQGPIRLEMAQLDPVEVDVFLKSSLACH